MKYYYHVFLGTKHIDLVQAHNSEHAIELVELKFGSARSLSHKHEYRAIKA